MRDILRLALPLSLWLASFSAIYGLHGLICAGYFSEFGREVLLGAAVLAIALQIAALLVVRAHPSPSPTLRFASLTLAAVALVATIWTALPVAFLSICS